MKRSIRLPRSVRTLYPKVKHAVDSTHSVHVSVDKKDCTDAKKLDPTNCALARAAKREFKADGVIIGISSSYIIKGDTATRFQTPESVRREIVSFDRHQDFNPGEYTLPPKAPAAKFGTPHPRTNRDYSKKPKHKQHMSARVRVLAKGFSSGD